jgi:hypothetical protein
MKLHWFTLCKTIFVVDKFNMSTIKFLYFITICNLLPFLFLKFHSKESDRYVIRATYPNFNTFKLRIMAHFILNTVAVFICLSLKYIFPRDVIINQRILCITHRHTHFTFEIKTMQDMYYRVRKVRIHHV